MDETTTLPQPPQPEAPQWLSKAAAAARLKKSERTVLEWADAGKIQDRRVVAPSGQTVREFHAGDIERLCYERDHPVPKAVQKPADLKLPQPPAPLALPPPPEKVKRGPWLTLDEAATRSGLPAACLKALVINGSLLAVDAGETTVRLRIHRDTLDAFRGANLGRA